MEIKIPRCLEKIDWKLWGSFFLIFLLYLPLVFLNDYPVRDVADRYAPAAEAFARGDWKYAFHPRIQSFHQIFSGCFTVLFSTDGFMGTKLSSLLFFALGIFPLFYLLKEVFNRKIAYWGIFAYMLASRLVVYAYSGLRDSHKQFAIILLALGMVYIYKYRERLKGYIIAGIACGCSTCIRNDMILFVVLSFAVCMVWDVYRNVFPWRSLIGAVFGFIFSLPEFIINYKITGYMIPGYRFHEMFVKIFHCQPTCTNVFLVVLSSYFCIFVLALPAFGWFLRKKYGKQICLFLLVAGLIFIGYKISGMDPVIDKKVLKVFFRGVLRGVFLIMFFIALPGFLYRVIRKKFTGPEWILLSLFVLQAVLVILQMLIAENTLFVTQRYILPGTPLYFGWLGISAMLVWRLLSIKPEIIKYRKAVSGILLTVFVILTLTDATSSIRYLYGNGKYVGKKKQIAGVAEIIRNDYKGERFKEAPLKYSRYCSNRYPTIWYGHEGTITISSYFAKGRLCVNQKEALYLVVKSDRKISLKEFQKVGVPISSGKDSVQVWRRK